MASHSVGILLFPRFETLDAAGPIEMLGVVPDHFRVATVAQETGPIASNQGPALVAEHDFTSCPDLDLVLVPGGFGTREEVENAALTAWIAERSRAAKMTLSVCTGAALLARAGVLDGRRATTNKRAFDWVAGQGPNVIWVKKARWVEDGPFFTSAGVSAGMDMALAVVERLVDSATAEAIARGTEYEWHRDPDWDPFAEIHGLV